MCIKHFVVIKRLFNFDEMGNIQKRALNNRQGIMAAASLKSACPKTTNSQVFNLNIASKDVEVVPEPEPAPENPEVLAAYPVDVNPYESKIDDTVETLQQTLNSKDSMINALSLIIEILENNPIIVNKWVIADDETLKQLITYLTGADEVDIEIGDFDCGCTGTKYVNVQSIYVIKDGQAQNFKYACPDACRILDNHRISTELVW